jgi:hypothetical protein
MGKQARNEEYALNQLLKKYQNACRMTNCGETMDEEKMGELLACMSFVNLEDSKEDCQLLHNLYCFLGTGEEEVSQDDLLYFLTILCNIKLDCRIENNRNLVNLANNPPFKKEDTKSIRKRFSKLYLNKISS